MSMGPVTSPNFGLTPPLIHPADAWTRRPRSPQASGLEGRVEKLTREGRRMGLSEVQANDAVRRAVGEAALRDHDEDWICKRLSNLIEQALEGSRNVIRYDENIDAAEMDAEAFLQAHHAPPEKYVGWDDVLYSFDPARVRQVIKEVLEGEVATVRIEENGEVREDDLAEVMAHYLVDRPVRFRVDPEPRGNTTWQCNECSLRFATEVLCARHFADQHWPHGANGPGVSLVMASPSGNEHVSVITGVPLRELLWRELPEHKRGMVLK